MSQKNSLSGLALVWVVAILGWLLCAGLCLWLTIALEPYPYAYDLFFPAILLILFCNVLLFLFIATRWGRMPVKLCSAVARLCVGEAIILAGMYCLGRFAM